MKQVVQSIFIGLRMSLVEMRSHKLRSSLSVLGVMLGVASLVTMLTLIAGIDNFLHNKMKDWAGSVWIVPRRNAQMKQKLTWSRSPGLHHSDGIFLKKKSHHVKSYHQAFERQMNIIITGRQEKKVRIMGLNYPSMLEELKETHIIEGCMLSKNSFSNAAPSCVISWELAEHIRVQQKQTQSSDVTLVGERCTINNSIFEIAGVFGPVTPDNSPLHLRRSVIMPISTMQRQITGYNPKLSSIRIILNDPTSINTKLLGIVPILRSRHRNVEDFQTDVDKWVEEIESMLSNVAILMGIVSAISLLVGGLSIMNVMLTNISERIHEIGIRKALGAKRLQIFIQFTVETIMLSCTGGVIGMGIGTIPIIFRTAIAESTDGIVEPTIRFSYIIGIFGIIVLFGVLFGLYPAIKASRMNPIEALRYE